MANTEIYKDIKHYNRIRKEHSKSKALSKAKGGHRITKEDKDFFSKHGINHGIDYKDRVVNNSN